MVGVAANNAECSVDLLENYYPREFVGERLGPEAQNPTGCPTKIGVKT